MGNPIISQCILSFSQQAYSVKVDEQNAGGL